MHAVLLCLPLGMLRKHGQREGGSISLTRAGTLLPNSEVSNCETEQRGQEMPCVYIGDTANLLTRSLVLQWLWSGRNGIITTKIFCGMLPDVLHTVIRRHLLQPGNHGSAGHLAYMPAVWEHQRRWLSRQHHVSSRVAVLVCSTSL